MTDVFIEHIPRCLFEPLDIMFLIGAVLFLYRHWTKDKAETLLLAFTLFFLFAWRMIQPIVSDRYAQFMIFPAIFFTIYLAEELGNMSRRFCRLPVMTFLLLLLAAACIVKTFHGDRGIIHMHEMIRVLKQNSGSPEKTVRVVSTHDISCFLGKGFEVETVCLGNPYVLSQLPAGDYYLLKVDRKERKIGLRDSEFAVVKEKTSGRRHSFRIVLWKRRNVR